MSAHACLLPQTGDCRVQRRGPTQSGSPPPRFSAITERAPLALRWAPPLSLSFSAVRLLLSLSLSHGSCAIYSVITSHRSLSLSLSPTATVATAWLPKSRKRKLYKTNTIKRNRFSQATILTSMCFFGTKACYQPKAKTPASAGRSGFGLEFQSLEFKF